MSVEKERWIAWQGSIYTEKIYVINCELSSGKFKANKTVAFNVGREVAEYIVALHNAALARQQ